MRRANGRKPPTNRRAAAHSVEEQEKLRRGLRILARMIARAHLHRQESQSGASPRPTAEHEDGE